MAFIGSEGAKPQPTFNQTIDLAFNQSFNQSSTKSLSIWKISQLPIYRTIDFENTNEIY